jgi:CysZ protein
MGMQSYLDANKFIRKYKMWKWVIWPGVIYCVLFAIGLYYIWIFSDFFTERISAYFGLEHWIQQLQSGWISFLFVLLGISVRLVFLIYYFGVFKYVFLIIGTPAFIYLNEKTAAILEKREFSLSTTLFLREIRRSLKLSGRNFVQQTLFTIALFIFSFIPVAGWLSPLIALVAECYYLGFAMLDYSNKQQNIPAAESIQMINEHRGLAIGNGLGFYLLHIILVVGWIFAPSYAVIASSIRMHQARFYE